MDSQYLVEVPRDVLQAQSAEYNFYWFQFTPPLPGNYSLSVNIDLAECKGSLQDQRLASVSSAVPDNSYCKVLLAKSTLRLRVAVLDLSEKAAQTAKSASNASSDSSDSSSKAIADAAVLFKSGEGIGGLCDLSDLSGTYWVYPAVPASFPMGKVLQHGIPRFHHPRCPSFYPRLLSLKGSVSLCVAGDSNSKRTCLYAQEHPRLAPSLSVYCRDFDHKLATILSKPEKGYVQAGPFNLEGYARRAEECVEAGASIIALNIGHHVADFTAADIRAKVFDPLMPKLTSLMSQRKGSDKVHRAGLVWATTASHVSFFPKAAYVKGGLAPAMRWPLSLLIKSNAYREVLQNQQLMCAVAGSKTCGSGSGSGSGSGYGAVSLTYKDFLDLHAKAPTRKKARLEFVDTFHPTLATASIAHQHGDPVHFSSEYYWSYGFLAKLLAVANTCASKPSSCDGLSEEVALGENIYFNYLVWNPVTAGNVTRISDRRQQRPSAFDFDGHAKRYVFA